MHLQSIYLVYTLRCILSLLYTLYFYHIKCIHMCFSSNLYCFFLVQCSSFISTFLINVGLFSIMEPFINIINMRLYVSSCSVNFWLKSAQYFCQKLFRDRKSTFLLFATKFTHFSLQLSTVPVINCFISVLYSLD